MSKINTNIWLNIGVFDERKNNEILFNLVLRDKRNRIIKEICINN